MRTLSRAAATRWAALFVLAGQASCADAAGRQAADPPALFRGDAAHRGVFAGDAGNGFGGVAWRVQTGGAVQGSPVASGSLLYVGSTDGLLYAIDRPSGAVRWTHDAHAPIASSPAVAEGIVAFTSRDRKLHALDARTGRERWQLAFGADLPWPWGHESGDFYLSSPNYAGGTLYVGAGDGQLYAVRARDGSVQWKAATRGRVRSSPAVDGDLVFVGSADGALYAFETATGRQRWRFETEGSRLASGSFGYDRRTVQSSPAVSDGIVFVGARDGFLYAVDRERGTLRWRADHEISWVNTSPAVRNGMVFAGSSDGRFVQAVDAQTGVERWRVTTPSLVWASPALAGDVVYAADWAGNLLALDARTGAERWKHRMGARMLSSPVIADGRIYVGSDDGGVYAYQTAPTTLERAVFWDQRFLKANTVAAHEGLRDYFAARGYRVLDADSLAAFLSARAADRAPSVVVFAIDALPGSVAAAPDESTLLRRYLAAGGKVVWVGIPPFAFPRDTATGQGDIAKIDRSGPETLLGVSHANANFDPRSAHVTDAGARWGLQGWWMMNWAADSAAVDEVLALDDQGNATAWVKRYGGRLGSGFVRIPVGMRDDGVSPAQMRMIQVAAEIW